MSNLPPLDAYWVSCAAMTVRVAVDRDQKIREAAPIVRRFKGQPLAKLTKWMEAHWGTTDLCKL